MDDESLFNRSMESLDRIIRNLTAVDRSSSNPRGSLRNRNSLSLSDLPIAQEQTETAASSMGRQPSVRRSKHQPLHITWKEGPEPAYKERTVKSPGALLGTDQYLYTLTQTPTFRAYQTQSGRILFLETETGSTSWKPPRKSVLSKRPPAIADRPDRKWAVKDGVVLWKLLAEKKWNVSFVLVEDGVLTFYREAADLSRGLIQRELKLKEADIDPFCSKSSRSHKIRLTTPSLTLLFKLEGEEECQSWISALEQSKNGAAKSPDLIVTQPSGLQAAIFGTSVKGQKSTNQKLGRPGLSRSFRKKMAELVELRPKSAGRQDSAQLRPTDRRSLLSREPSRRSQYLSRFLRRRPTHEELKASGIIQDNSVFGCPLERQLLASDTNLQVPEFLWKCIQKIESKPENLDQEGLYRIPGDVVMVQKIRLEVDQNNWNTFNGTQDVHILAGCLKLFLRELPDPVIPYRLHEPALQLLKDGASLLSVLGELSRVERDTLCLVCRHLERVSAADNKMSADSLAMVFGLVLIWPDPNAPLNLALVAETAKHCQIVHALIDGTPDLFPSVKYTR